MNQVKYFAPSNLKEALEYYKANPDAQLFAGGTDLLVGLEYGKVELTHILDLKGLSNELDYIIEDDKQIRIGAMTPFDKIEHSEIITKRYPFYAYAASVVGSWQLRTTATVGGNVCNGAPSAESTPSYLILNAKVVVAGANGERTLPIADFLVAPGKVALNADEILKEFIIEHEGNDIEGMYACRKLRRSMDVALINLATGVKRDAQGVITDARVALGAVAITAFRATEAETFLVGKKLDDDTIKEAAEIAGKCAKPITDVRATAEYRREMVKLYTKMALTAIRDGKQGGLQE